jgi:thymidylate synthase (FAD)
MQVNLISISKPNLEYTGCSTAQELVAWCARVSNPNNQQNHESAPKLLKYLINNKHWSPLEMVHIAIEIKTTRDIARQILRHRSFSFQEFSQRYADPTVATEVEYKEARLQDTKNRQNSLDVTDESLSQAWLSVQTKVQMNAMEAYGWAIQNGIAKEQARAVLPEGITGSTLIMAGSLRSWVHYCELRMTEGTQKEHREIARECWKIICSEFPIIDGIIDTQK